MGQKSTAFERPWILFPEAPESFEAAFMPTSLFPFGSSEFRQLRDFLAKWMDQLAAKHLLTATTWIQMTNLHQGDAAQRLSRNGPHWLPELGLGVWPDREPPRIWTLGDFHELGLGQAPPPLMYTVFHLSKGEQAAKEAWEELIGSGTLICALLSNDSSEFHQGMTNVFLPRIQEEALRGYPFYMPLLDRKSLEVACALDSRSQPQRAFNQVESSLDLWLGSAKLYVRESTEDEGILMLTSLPEAFHDLREWVKKLR